ncbi:MAG: DUF4364 family protein [Clostridia bacterium]|nr:DUF4364 family protein [Clostridia bacterium]
MAKGKEYELKSLTDIKIFILFILDTMRYPVDTTTLRNVIFENIVTPSTEYEECLNALVDDGHVIHDAIDGEDYYMVSETGRRISAELYDTLDPVFRERSRRSAMKYFSLADKGAKTYGTIREADHSRFEVELVAEDSFGKIMDVKLWMNSREEAENVQRSFEVSPDSVFRGVMFSATGKMTYLP